MKAPIVEESPSTERIVAIDIVESDDEKELKELNSDKEKKTPSAKKDYVVYEYYGQNIVPPSVTWVQFFGGDDTEDARPESNTPFDPKTRNAFVRLVFMIVFAMILVTMIINLIFRFTWGFLDGLNMECRCGFVLQSMKHLMSCPECPSNCTQEDLMSATDNATLVAEFWADTVPPLARLLTGKSGLIIAIVCIILYFVLTISVASKCAWYPPGNYIILVSSVIVFSIITAYSTVYTKSVVIILAIIATLIVVLICLFIACSSWDFTKFLTYIFVVATAFAAISILITVAMYAFKIKFKPLVLALLVIGVLIQSVVLIVQLQLTLGGKTVATGEEFYIICAFSLYTSIISIFLQLLRFIKLVS